MRISVHSKRGKRYANKDPKRNRGETCMTRSVVLLMGHRKVGTNDELDYRLKDKAFAA